MFGDGAIEDPPKYRIMTSIAELEIAADGTGLAELYEVVPSLTCEMEDVAVSSGYSLWLSGASQAEIQDALNEASAIDEYSLISSDDDRGLYDVTFNPETVNLFELVLEEGGTILSASAADGSWHLRVRVLDRDDISSLYDELVEYDLEPTIVRLFDVDDESPTQSGLTERQYETLTAAIDHGYFEIPRQVSMQELSDELDISHQALSERLRRAYQTLVMSELDVTAEETETTPQLATSD